MKSLEKYDLSAFESGENLGEEEYLRQIKEDKATLAWIKSLGLSVRQVKDNLGKIISYMEDRKTCLNCPGLENCPKDNPGYDLDFYLAPSGYLERTLGPCPLAAQESSLSSRFLYRDYGEEYRHADLGAEEWRAPGRRKLLKALTEGLSGKGQPFVYLSGQGGSGRTYLAAAFLNSVVLRQDKTAAFVSCPRRMGEFSSLYFSNRGEFEAILRRLSAIEVLCLDDFGSEYITDILRDAFYVPLLSGRKEKGKLTVFTSDYPLEEVSSIYAGKGPRAKGLHFQNLIADSAAEISLSRSVASLASQR